jgi:hypothetical protein
VHSSTSSSDLVKASEPTATARWLSIASIAALMFFAAYVAGVSRVTRLPFMPDMSNDDYVHAKALRYFFDQNRIVLAGSSLFYNLNEDYFTNDVANLGFPGGISVTGAEIVASSRTLPEILLIEANVIDRTPERSVYEPYQATVFRKIRILVREFRPLRVLINALMYGYPRTADRKEAFSRLAHDIEAKAPANENREAAYKLAESTRNRPYRRIAESNAARLVSIARDLERRGVKVYFVDLPMHPILSEHRSQIDTMQILKEAGADHWLNLNFDRSELRFTDGAHLDERSAILVIQAIEAALR